MPYLRQPRERSAFTFLSTVFLSLFVFTLATASSPSSPFLPTRPSGVAKTIDLLTGPSWACAALDPVMGDQGKLYVDASIVPAYRNLLRDADLILPNQFELECVPYFSYLFSFFSLSKMADGFFFCFLRYPSCSSLRLIQLPLFSYCTPLPFLWSCLLFIMSCSIIYR